MFDPKLKLAKKKHYFIKIIDLSISYEILDLITLYFDP